MLREIGIDESEFRFVDGSGLAPDDLVTASAVTDVLRWMDAPQRRGLYRSVLAQPGESGTLRLRLAPLGGRFWGKTGTVAGVNSLAGITVDTDGRLLAFSIIADATASAAQAEAALDRVAAAIAACGCS